MYIWMLNTSQQTPTGVGGTGKCPSQCLLNHLKPNLMKTLTQFKNENKVSTIDLLQGKGRAYCTVGTQKLFVASKTALDKPLFVTDSIRRPIEGIEVTPETVLDNSNSIEDFSSHWLVNSDVKTVATV